MKSIYTLFIVTFFLSCNTQNSTSYSCKSDLTSDKDGYQKIYHDNGKIKAIGHFLENTANGFIKEYYNNGKLKIVGHYYKGKLYGFVKHYDKKGNLIYQGNCNCKPISKLSK